MWLERIIEWQKACIPSALVTIIEATGSTPRKTGSKMAVAINGESCGSVGGGAVEFLCIQLAKEVMAKNTCITRHFISKGEDEDWILSEDDTSLGICGGSVTVFIEPFIVDPELVIFGGGHIALNLGKLCEVLEIPYRVYDDRNEYPVCSRFSGAKELICAPFDDILAHLSLNRMSFCVVMTYGHRHDEKVLEQLLKNSEIPYIGMIGSKKKAEILIENIRERGGIIDNRVYCPVGIRFGRNLPQEIAFSVLAEVFLLMRGGSLEHMRIDWSEKIPGI